MRGLTDDPSFLATYRDEEKMQEEQTVVEKITLSVRRHPRRQEVCSWDVIWEKITLSVRSHPRRQEICSWDVIWEFGLDVYIWDPVAHRCLLQLWD